MSKIGFQDGIQAFENWFKGFSKWIDEFNTWGAGPRTTAPPKIPRIPLDGPNFDPNNMETWSWPTKFFDNTMRKLKDDHDAAVSPPDPPDPPDPPAGYKKVAPRVAYAQDGSDARFCLTNPDGTLRPGVVQRPDGKYTDDSGAVYTNLDGLDESGRRSPAPALTGAREIDGRPICSLPMSGDPFQNTGSWAI